MPTRCLNALLGGVLLTSDNPAQYGPAAREQYRSLREMDQAEGIRVDADHGLPVIYTQKGTRFRIDLT